MVNIFKKLIFGFVLFGIPQFVFAATPKQQSQKQYEEAFSLAMRGDLENSIPAFEKAIQSDRKNFLAVFDLGGVYEALGQKEKALSLYEQTTRLKPNFIEAQNQTANLYLLFERNYDKSIQFHKSALLEKNPYVISRFPKKNTIIQSLRNLSVAYAQKKQFGFALGIARSTLAQEGCQDEDRTALHTLVERASQDLAKDLERNCKEILASISKLLYGEKEKQALLEYQTFEKDPKFKTCSRLDAWDLYEGMGIASVSLQQPQKAEVAFRQALDSAKSLPYTLLQESTFNLACALAEQNKQEEVFPLLEEVLWIDFVTIQDPDRQKGEFPKELYIQKIQKHGSLQKIKNHPQILQLLKTYKPYSKP